MKTNYKIELIEDSRLDAVVGGVVPLPTESGLYRFDEHSGVYVKMPSGATANMPLDAVAAAGFVLIEAA